MRKTELSNKQQILAQLRFDYTSKQLGKCKLFGPRADSQDSWIFHSNFNPYKQVKIFNFIFGKPGCDNKLIYLFTILGFEVFNQPYFVKTYHIQKSEARDYGKDMLPHPYMMLSPHVSTRQITNTQVWGTVGWRLINNHKLTIESITKNFTRFMFKTDNNTLREYLRSSLENDDTFLIPHTDMGGTILASTCLMLNNVTHGTFFQTGQIIPQYQNDIQVKHFWNTMIQLLQQTPNHGIGTTMDIIQYAVKYLEAFNKAKICIGFSTWNKNFKQLLTENKQDFYRGFFDSIKHRQWISSTVTNIFTHLYLNPWIKQLNRQKLLIISPYADGIKNQINTIKLKNLYNFDIFADCEFCFIKFKIWNTQIQEQIVNELGNFDIVLCDCGLFGSLVSNYIYGIGKSVIDIGDILPLYFGLWKSSDMGDNKDIIQLYLNQSWKRI